MRTQTNKHNMPAAIVAAVKADDYSRGNADYSVTDLLKPVRQLILERRHEDEIVEDVVERIWSMQGRVSHKIMETYAEANAFKEERLHWTFTVDEDEK
jgi:uncharacterized membrane protein